MDVLAKVSGDLIDDEKFYDWLLSVADTSDKLVIVHGGGTQITKTLKENGIEFEFGPAGREIKSHHGRYLAWMVLRGQRTLVEKRLRERGIVADVDIPVKKIGKMIYHINGDRYAVALSVNFDKVFIVTLKGRDKSFVKDLDENLRNKIEVVYL